MAAFSILVGAILASAANAIYPDGHWDHSTELTASTADDFVKKNVDAGKTQAPSWNKVAKDFSGHEDVVFGDVSLSKNQVRDIHGTPQNPGAGGWPTVRHFNKQTGYGGEAYKQKTSSAMCDELGPKEEYMQQYIEEIGGVSQCSVTNTDVGCSEEQKKFIAKWGEKSKGDLAAQLARLSGMIDKDGSSMKPEALKWAKQRLNIVKQFSKQKDEL